MGCFKLPQGGCELLLISCAACTTSAALQETATSETNQTGMDTVVPDFLPNRSDLDPSVEGKAFFQGAFGFGILRGYETEG